MAGQTVDTPVKGNPANAPAKRVTEATRIPMSIPVLQLSVPEIPGYHLHWFLAKNIARAKAAGYEFVDEEEVAVNNRGVADNLEESGSSDLGTRVSVIGGMDEQNNPERLYLMKLRDDWHDEDVRKLGERNDKIAQALRAGLIGAENDPDAGKRYLKQGAGLFFPKTRKV